MSSSAYISNGFGINYYTGNSQQTGYMQQVPGPGPSTSSTSAGASPAHQALPQQSGSSTSGSSGINYPTTDPGLRRRLFAGIRPLSVFGRLRQRSSQHRSISLPESNYVTLKQPKQPENHNIHLGGNRGDSNYSHYHRPIPMQKSFHLPASTCSTTTSSSSYLGDAYNIMGRPIIAMRSRWNSTAFDSHYSTSMFRLCFRVLCIFLNFNFNLNLFPV